MRVLDAVLEVFTWIGLAAGLLILLVAVLMRIIDGAWLPTTVLIEDGATGRVARWFAHDGGVGEAVLTSAQEQALAGKDAAEAYTRPGVIDRFRLTRGSPAVRAAALLGAGLLTYGVASGILSLVLLFAAE